MVSNEKIFKMAYSFLRKKIPIDTLREFEDRGINAEKFFTLPTKELIFQLGIPHDHDFDKIAREEALAKAEKEFLLIEKHNIKPLYVLDEDYPSRLSETYDPPIILYVLGNCDFDGEHFISVVGTRKPTPYGLDFCHKLVDNLSDYFPDLNVISGLAYGIDTAAHKKSLEKGINTMAVLAHGLNMIYPAANRYLAKEIIRSGGSLISEYPFGTKPFKANFLARNRIVAGLSDTTVVVESNIKGGAMSTANFAFLYNRDVMALPGRSSDDLSSGCNLLIRKNKAHLIESAADFIEVSGWKPLNFNIESRQRNLFPELEGDAQRIYEFMRSKSDPIQLDQLVHALGLQVATLTALLSDMEFDGIIIRYPGNRFSIS